MTQWEERTRTCTTGIVARGRIYVAGDNRVYAFNLPAGTPTPTPTASPTPTPTATRTYCCSLPLLHATATATPAFTPTATATATATASATPTATATATSTATVPPSPTPTPSVCFVIITDPDCGSVINAQPVDFSVQPQRSDGSEQCPAYRFHG